MNTTDGKGTAMYGMEAYEVGDRVRINENAEPYTRVPAGTEAVVVGFNIRAVVLDVDNGGRITLPAKAFDRA